MYKRDEYFYRADPIGSVVLPDRMVDIQGFNASDDIEGSDHNTDAYVEALVPVLEGRRESSGSKPCLATGAPSTLRPEASMRTRRNSCTTPYRPASAQFLPARSACAQRLRAVPAPVTVSYDADPDSVLDPCTAGSPQRSGPNAPQVEALCLARACLPTRWPSSRIRTACISASPW